MALKNILKLQAKWHYKRGKVGAIAVPVQFFKV
jgi:hypothetical protein